LPSVRVVGNETTNLGMLTAQQLPTRFREL